MAEQKPIFKNRKDQNDFFIALFVLLFFGLLMWYSGILGQTPKNFFNNDEITALDLDGDGYENSVDDCPELYGEGPSGCPLDSDKDGIIDSADKCPNEKGTRSNDGCPVEDDSDGDGVPDADDRCPNDAGDAAHYGCPIDADTDGDGVPDYSDKCPLIAGMGSADGCPRDTDQDGIIDSEDRCPNTPGIISNQGCPQLRLTTQDAMVLSRALSEVQFETGSATLKKSSYKVLNDIVAIMERYPLSRLIINGHTDNVDTKELNRKLSKSRANTCKRYLLSKGISSTRIETFGYGETRPTATNDTPQGRALNRRVEFILR